MTANELNAMLTVETATLGHIISDGFMSPQMQCLTSDIRICGPAITVSMPEDDGYILPFALAHAQPGDVLVIERTHDDRHACWGAVMTEAAIKAGIVAVILDGYITDISAIREAGLPIWCKGRSPLTTKAGKKGGTINQAIQCDSVAVHAGDLILADENGVAVISPDDLSGLMSQALDIQAKEPLVIERIRKGESLAAIYYEQP